MHPIIVAAALYPALIAALPLDERSASATRIPLTKAITHTFLGADGLVDLDVVSSYIDHVTAKYENQGAQPLAARANTLPLNNNAHTTWTGEITLGTPPKKFTAMFDTGSSDLVVPTQSGCVGCHGGVYYDTATSSSSKALNKTFSLKYGSGEVSGKQFSDTVTVAGVTAKSQTVLAADKAADGFFGQLNALVGLSFGSKSSQGVKPLVQTLRDEGKLAEPVFGFKLSDSGSEITIGGTNKNAYTGKVTYLPVTSDKYWQVKFDKLAVWDKTFKPASKSAVIDSGTSLILADQKTVDSFYNDIVYGPQKLDNGMWSVNCYNIPQLNITFGGKNIFIPSNVFTLGQVAKDSDYCLGGIQASPLPFWIMGDELMRNVYIIFDAGKKRVGFATLKK